MQRQSLGSPGAKHLPLPIHGGGDDHDDDDGTKQRKKKVGGGAGVLEIDGAGAEDDEIKPERPFRRSSVGAAASASAAAAGTERSIHLIPVLTLLCFLVLYLCSHDPSATDMADLGVVGRLFDRTASSAEIGRFAAGGRGVVSAAVRSHRSLKELQRIRGHHGGGSSRSNSNRKLGRWAT